MMKSIRRRKAGGKNATRILQIVSPRIGEESYRRVDWPPEPGRDLINKSSINGKEDGRGRQYVQMLLKEY